MLTANNKNKVLLFIPFSDKENNQPLLSTAKKWQDNVAAVGKNIPEIIVYNNETTENQDKSMHARFSEDIIPFGTTIYLLAHGTNDPHWVANAGNLEDYTYQLPIELAARRAKGIGFTPNLVNNINAFKLFICEESLNLPAHPTTNLLTAHFAHELGNQYDNLHLIYYSAKVYIPDKIFFDPAVKKRAISASCHKLLSIATANDPSTQFSPEKIAAFQGVMKKNFISARKYQHIVSNLDARQTVRVSNDKNIMWCLKYNKATSLEYAIFSSLLKPILEKELEEKEDKLEKKSNNK